jgi:hypothetical protein
LVYVFDAATERSGPADSGIVISATAARSELGSFVSPRVRAPRSRVRAMYSTTSGVRPDCDRPMTTELERSNVAP